MLASFFDWWERRLHARSDDRTVRPFDWGLDWLPAPDNGRGSKPPEQAVAEWAHAAVADSDAFFAIPAATDFRWEPHPSGRDGSCGTLVFPSPLTTPDAANNIVTARLFPARRPGRREDRRRAVLVLPQWNADERGHVGLCQILARFGLSALRLSLPYHDRRMPAGLRRADFIVSANLVRTVQVCRQAVMDARMAIRWLAGQGYERVGILGTSLGSCLAMLTSAHEPLIRAQALNHISRYFADVIWEGLSTRHVREGLDGHVSLDRLRQLWMPISPQAYVSRVRDTRTLLVYARYDTTFPVHLSLDLVREFDRLDIPYQLSVLPCGHYTTGLAPFKYLDGYVLTRFLLRNL